VQDRGKFYDEVGALLDVVQNHMLQVVANLTIDPPTGEDYDGVRDRKSELMRAIRPLKPENVVRGQYEGYRKVPVSLQDHR
jgi:glucose-6-phosphate 1-dehydrogenase